MTVQGWTFVMVGLTFGLYLYLAIRARVRDTQGFYVAGRGVPAILNGMATAADWMSAASFLSMAGTISLLGYAKEGTKFLFSSYVSGHVEGALVNFAFDVLPSIVFFSSAEISAMSSGSPALIWAKGLLRSDAKVVASVA